VSRWQLPLSFEHTMLKFIFAQILPFGLASTWISAGRDIYGSLTVNPHGLSLLKLASCISPSEQNHLLTVVLPQR